MITTLRTRVITAVAAPAILAAVLAGGVALAADPTAVAATPSCITTGSMAVTPNTAGPQTRPALMNAFQPSIHIYAPPTACFGN